MREMGQSAWLSTSYLLYMAQREESMRGRQELAVTTEYHGAIIILSGQSSAEGRQTLGEESGARFVSFFAAISRRSCYRSSSTLALGSLPR